MNNSKCFTQKEMRLNQLTSLIVILAGLIFPAQVAAQSVLTISTPEDATSGGTCQTGTLCEYSWTFETGYLFVGDNNEGPLTGFKVMYVEASNPANEQPLLQNVPPSEDGTMQLIQTLSIPPGTYKLKIIDLYGENGTIEGNHVLSSNFTISAGSYINITSPTSGIITHGEVITVQYTTNTTINGIYLKNQSNTTVATANGSNQISVLSSFTEGDYTILVDGVDTDASSATFRIEPKRLQITYPYDGLVFQRGVADPTIQWTANYQTTSGVEIWVEDEDNSWPIAAAAGPSTLDPNASTSFTWDIESNFHLDNDFEIYISDNANPVSDIQTGTFTITDPFGIETFALNASKTTVIKTPISSESGIDGLSVSEKAQSISYVDGTGKVRQTNSIKSSPTQKDMITPFSYNEIGQSETTYLPFATLTTDGVYVSDVLDDQYKFYCFLSACNSTATNVTGNSHPYSRVELEASPLQTVKEQGSLGEDWQPGSGNSIRFETHANISTDNIVHWVLDSNGNPKGNDFYLASSIAITKTTDEDENISYVYSDREGQEILKLSFLNGEGSTVVKTYYIYDEFGNLRFIVPPEAVSEIEVTTNYETMTLGATDQIRSTWFTEMKYDGYNRLVSKKIPEATEPVYTVYDKLGRVVLTQDGMMRASNEWFFTKYDIKGRTIMSGIYTESDVNRQSREQMQDYVNTWPGAIWEDRTSTNYDTQHGYTFQAFPNSLIHSVIWSVNYYDDYDFDNNGTPDESFSGHADFASLTGNNRSAHEADITRTEGMVTGSKTRILTPRQVFENDNGEYGIGHPSSADEVYYIGTTNNNYSIKLKPGFKTYPGQKVHVGSSDIVVPVEVIDTHDEGEWLEGVTFFDKYGRTIYSKSTNHLQGTDRTWTLYHFDGEVEQTIYTHSSGTYGAQGFTIKNRFEYDHDGRIIAEYQNTNGQGEIKIVENEYNEIGQLITKKMGNTTGSNFLQTLNYTYHLRGWLESVNDPANLGSDLFAYRLYYDEIPTSGLSLAKYNGNIIAQDWATDLSGNTERHRYSYSYDGINQLLEAEMSRWTGSTWQDTFTSWNTNYSYDLNGNIKTLFREGEPDIDGYPTNLDNLNYTYIGNKVQAISDYGGTPGTIGFVDGITASTEYEYNDNGNMISDDNKGITSISYNQMNLPEIITFSSGSQIVYLYDAAGSKLSKTTYPAGGGSVVTDYVNGVVYNGGNLDFASFSEGRIRYNGSFELEYDIKDHLGNVRATFKDGQLAGTVLLQADSYYPFGYKMPGLSYVSSGADENKFTYNGKELENEFGLDWYHYGWRFYDPLVGRWWATDPAEEFHSPYNYVSNNPIRHIDPDGRESFNTNPDPALEKMIKFNRIAKKYGIFEYNEWSSRLKVEPPSELQETLEFVFDPTNISPAPKTLREAAENVIDPFLQKIASFAGESVFGSNRSLYEDLDYGAYWAGLHVIEANLKDTIIPVKFAALKSASQAFDEYYGDKDSETFLDLRNNVSEASFEYNEALKDLNYVQSEIQFLKENPQVKY